MMQLKDGPAGGIEIPRFASRHRTTRDWSHVVPIFVPSTGVSISSRYIYFCTA
jgi:hypothetical protein